MKRRLVYILKHNIVVQMCYKVSISFLLRFLGLFVVTDPNLILFSSFMGTKVNDSPKAIYDYIKSHSEYCQYKCVWAVESPNAYPALQTVKIDTLRYFCMALRAHYWVTNTNIERGLSFKKKSTIYLNTWHGIALKKIGNDCPGRKDYNFASVDFLCVSGEYEEKVFHSAFKAKGENFLQCGMPRNDSLWAITPQNKRDCREKLSIPEGKKVILYAPTWRDSTDRGKTYTLKPPINFERWERSLGHEYVVLFRAHHITTTVLNVEFNDFVRDVSGYPDVNDLMIAADLLITDYSAIAFDYAILGRPILTYAYDYDTYLAERGTYFDMDDKYPSKTCRTETALLDRICSLDFEIEEANTRRFRNEFVQFGGNATEICTKSLFANRTRGV